MCIRDRSGSDTLTFTYTVQDGDTTSDLDYQATGSLSGTLKDTALNNATLTLVTPGNAGSLAANKALVLDTTSPTITNVTATTADGSYKADDTITITVTLSEAVDVTGTPTLTLGTGNNATYASGSGSDTLTFTYTVQDGDTTSDLDYQATGSLSGTLKDTALNNATLTLVTPGASGSLADNKALVLDTTSPTITNVTATTADGSYKADDTITITVTLSEAVDVTGTPTLTLGTGNNATYSSGSGSDTLTFTYTVQDGDSASKLDYE